MNKVKRIVLINKILCERLKAAKIIQFKYKEFKFRKKINDILIKERKSIKFTYPYKAKEVTLLLYNSIDEMNCSLIIKKFKFEFCDVQKMLVLYLKPSSITSEKYKAHLEVDGFKTCDGRYPLYEDDHGQYFNVIDIKSEANKNRHLLSNFGKSGFN